MVQLVVDIGQELFVKVVKFQKDNKTGEVLLSQTERIPMTEELIDELEGLIGDANAKVTIGQELKVSEDYKTTGSSAYVTLTCNQDTESIARTREIGQKLAHDFAAHGLDELFATMDEIHGKKVERPEPLQVIPEYSTHKKKPKNGKPGFRS